MRNFILLMTILSFNSALGQAAADPEPAAAFIRKPVLVIHGGAGTILKKNMTAEKEKAYTEGLKQALEKGYAILEKGGSALDAVEAAVKVMEDNPLFNAGKGAVFTHEGTNELDAAIMDGKTLGAGSVAGVTTIRNPITAARAVMERSSHVMMTGKGAEQFAADQGIPLVDPSYFYTKERWKGLQRVLQEDSARMELDHGSKKKGASLKQPENKDSKYGTVGAVALDQAGHLAAATSTGGMTNKRYGRVGDAPIIGAGTYANDAICAISCTGWGEYFIRLVMAKSVSDRMEFGNWSLLQAADDMILKKLPALGGDGGLIGVDKDGNIVMPFCTEGMYRGFMKEGKMEVRIYKEGMMQPEVKMVISLKTNHMSKNKETVTLYMQAFNQKDHAKILSCLTDDITWVLPGVYVHKGKAAFDKEIENEGFTGKPIIEVSRMTEENNVVIAEGTVQAQTKNGATVNLVFCDVFEMENGLIKKLISYLMPIQDKK